MCGAVISAILSIGKFIDQEEKFILHIYIYTYIYIYI